jgi:hypothetical protein
MRDFPRGIPKESIFYPGFYIAPNAVVGWEDILYMLLRPSAEGLSITGQGGGSDSYPPHFSISTRQEFGAMPGAFLDKTLSGVRMLTQPPLSMLAGLPGSRGSYLLEP